METMETARKRIFGFAQLMDELPLRSAAARRAVWTLPWYGPAEAGALQAELARQRAFGAFYERAEARGLSHVKRHLEQTPDLSPTFRQLREERGALDDIQLFELKNWLLPMGETARFARLSGIDLPPVPELTDALDLLDPLKERLPSFYIYDCYDPRLPVLRKRLKALVMAEANLPVTAAGTGEASASAGGTASAGQPLAGSAGGPAGGGSSFEIEEQLTETEREVRTMLSRRLRDFLPDLEAALERLTAWDFLIAKTEWTQAQGCCCPEILTDGAMAFEGLFYPPLLQQCQAQGRPYQAVDITLHADACLLTGANMSGKTILIKSIALAQTLAQFGFFVPAAATRLTLFDEICRIVGDEQNESRGLSSFGAEILSLHAVLQKLRQGRRVLFLADELARTTNPTEGSAIVCAFFDLWHRIRTAAPAFASTALVSTHYENIGNAPRRLRVKGLDTARWAAACRDRAAIKADGQPMADQLLQLQNFMDYGVEEVHADSPAEMQALDVAACLGVDAELIETARHYGHRQANATDHTAATASTTTTVNTNENTARA